MTPRPASAIRLGSTEPLLDAVDRQIIVATQSGLPRVARPYHAIAAQLGVTAEEVMRRMRRMLETGIIRRIGAVPNHYALGYQANGMSVWDVPDERVRELGKRSARWILSATVIIVPGIRLPGRTTCSPWCTGATAPKSRSRLHESPRSWAMPTVATRCSTARAS